MNGGFLENLTFKEILLADLANKNWNDRICINENINLHISHGKLPLSSLWSPHHQLWTPGFSSGPLDVPRNHNPLDPLLHYYTCSGPTISIIIIIIFILIIIVIRGDLFDKHQFVQVLQAISSLKKPQSTDPLLHCTFDWEISSLSSLSCCSAKWIIINIML